MSNIPEKKLSGKKRKFSERLELLKEFKGLNNLEINVEKSEKKQKIDINDAIDSIKNINESIILKTIQSSKKDRKSIDLLKSNETIQIKSESLEIDCFAVEINDKTIIEEKVKGSKKDKKNKKSSKINAEILVETLDFNTENFKINELTEEIKNNDDNIAETSKHPKKDKKDKKNKKSSNGDIDQEPLVESLEVNSGHLMMNKLTEEININDGNIEDNKKHHKKDKKDKKNKKSSKMIIDQEILAATFEVNNENFKLDEEKNSSDMNVKHFKKDRKNKTFKETSEVDKNVTLNVERPKNDIPKKKTYIILENIDTSVTKDDLDNYLKSNGINVDKLSVVPGPLAVTFFNREKDLDRLFNICQGIYFKSNELLIVKSSLKVSNVESNVTNMSDLSIHIKNLDITTTEDDIGELICDMTKVRTITINTEKRTAIIDFTESQFAQECISKLDNFTLGENKLQASFLVKTQRPDQFVLKVCNLPYGFNKVNIQESFPSAWKVKIIKGQNRYCHIHFKTIEEFDAVLHNDERVLVKGVPVLVEEITKSVKKVEKKDNFVLNVFNMPFDMTLKEIKEQYPSVRYIEMLKNTDGLFMGSAKLNFEEKEDCEEALKNTKGLTLKHRRIRAEMKVEHGGTKDDEQMAEDDE